VSAPQILKGRVGKEPAWAWVLAAIASVIGTLPLLLFRLAPLQDWPSHLARIQIMETMLRGPSLWDRFYELNGLLLPNAAMDIFVLVLMRVGLGIDWAGRIFLLICYSLFVGGVWRLAQATGSSGALKALLGAFLFYNAAVFFGLVNFQLGLAVLLWCVAFWLRAGTGLRVALAVLGTAVIFLCNLVAVFLYVGIIGCLDLYALAASRGRSLISSLSLLALATAVGLLMLSPTGGDSFEASWTGAGSIVGVTYWKAGIFAKTMLGGAPLADLVFIASVVLLLAVVALGCRVQMAGRMGLVVAAIVMVTLAAPQHLGMGSFLDYRIAAVPILFAVASARITPRGVVWGRALVVAAAAAVIARAGVLTLAWSEDNVAFAQLDETLAMLPPGGALLGGLGRPLDQVSWSEYWSLPVNNSASRGVVHGLFVPTVFANRFQQPLALKLAYRKWDVYEDVRDPAALAESRARAAPLCADFPAGVHMLVLYPSAVGLSGMVHIGSAFGLVDLCSGPAG
jgi:hypothetical protein